MNFTLKVEQAEAQLILAALSELPYKTVAVVLPKLYGQLQEQEQAKKPELKVVENDAKEAVANEIG